MRFKAIYYIFLAWTAIALASDSSEPKPRPARHLHQIKEMIVNKLFGASKCTQNQPEQPETKFYRIPGFDNVVIKAVPKTPTQELPSIADIPSNSQIGIIGSYLGTNTINDTFNALQGVKNLLQSGILGENQGAIDELSLLNPTSDQNIAFAQRNPVKPCLTPGLINPVPLAPIRVLVVPPKVPKLVPTQYSYKQINQDGSLTTYTSSLNLQNGVKVTEDGKTLPFFVNRIRKIPVRLPVPVLPEVSKIIVANPFDVTFGRYPVDVIYPGSTFSYKQLDHDGRLTTYSGVPSMNGKYDGPMVITETDKAIPSPPFLVFLMDRVEKVAPTASYPKTPSIQPTPMLVDVAAGNVFNNEPPLVSRVPVSGPGKYSYTQKYNNEGNGGDTIAQSASSTVESFVNNPAVFEHKPPGSSTFSYNQVYSGGKMASFTGSDVQEYAGEHVAASAPVTPGFQGMPPASNSFSYKQVGNEKVTIYNGADISEEGRGSPTVMVHAVNHPVPPAHIADRIEKVAAGAKFNRPPLATTLLGNPFTVPIPTAFVRIPSVHTSLPQHPVRVPSTSGMSPFVYKHIHRDGSVSSFGVDGAVTAEVESQVPNMGMPMSPGYHRVYEYPINTNPFPMEENPNAVKPSTPVSGSYAYKLVNNGPVNIQEGPIDGYQNNITPPDIPMRNDNNQPFPVEENPNAVKSSTPVSGSYAYKLVNNGPVNIQEGPIDGYQNNITPPDVPMRNDNNQPFPVEESPNAVKPSTPVSGSYAYKLVNNGPVNIQEGPIDGYQNNITPPDVPMRNDNNQPFPVPPPMSMMPAPAQGCVDPEIVNPNMGTSPNLPIVFQEPVIPLSYTYKQINHNKPGEFLVVNVEDPLRDIKKVHERLQNNQANQQYPNGFPGGEVYENPNNYFIPPPSNGPAPSVPQILQEKIPPSSFSYKQVSNEGVYEYSNNFGSTGIKTNKPEITDNPQDNPARNVKQTPLEIAPSSPISNNQNAFTNNPIVVPEETSFSFKQSNMDGSSITVKDNGENSVSVDVEPPTSDSSQGPESSSFDLEEEEGAPSSTPVQGHAAPTGSEPSQEPPKTETSSRRPMVRRRKIKRKLKPRGDIPEADS